MNFTVEQVSRVLNRLNMGFTTASARRLVDSKLKKVPRPNSHYNTSFNYLVDVKRLEDYLINECGFDANTVDLRQDFRHTLLNFFDAQRPFCSVPHPE